MSQNPTGTFGQLSTGERFKIPWCYGTMTKVDADDHNAEQTLPDSIIPYRFHNTDPVIQDIYTGARR